MSATNPWTWSEAHQDHYYATSDSNGQPVYTWYKQTQTSQQNTQSPQQHASSYSQSAIGSLAQTHSQAQYATYQTSPDQYDSQQQLQYVPQNTQQAPTYQPHIRADSGSYQEPGSNIAQMPPPIPAQLRSQLHDLIPGTPSRGWYENLDSGYRMRTGYEAHQFFKKGRVFAVLWAEAASETAARQANGGDENDDGTVRKYNDAYTVGRFGQAVYSQIRRFVIMRVKKKEHFVYACPITTYSGRATTKWGCNPAEHTIVHFAGSQPTYVQGEYGNGMVKDPIEILPADPNATMDAASRLRFGKTYPVEWNVKVKDIGKVNPQHMSKLIRYWKEEDFYDSDDDE